MILADDCLLYYSKAHNFVHRKKIKDLISKVTKYI